MDTKELIKELRRNLSRDQLKEQAKISNYTISKYDRKIITDLGEEIIKLRKEGKSVKNIAKELKCSKSTVSSYCHLIEDNDKIKEQLITERNTKRTNAALFKTELKWIKNAIKKSRYKGTFNYQTNCVSWRRSIIEHFGNKCMKCGSKVDVPHFHHIDPAQKKFQINSKTRNKSKEEWVEEVNKCSMLCANCHDEVHKLYITELPRCNISINELGKNTININDIKIKTINKSKLDLICASMHYLGQSNKSGYSYGFFHNDQIVAVALITNPTRNESKINNEETVELSRFLIIGEYRTKNLASKCLSLLIRELRGRAKWLISFSEDGIHLGTIYKAANFKEIGKTKPSYNYEGIHKKTIYERAKTLDMTEHEYSAFFNLRRIRENPKTKFAYNIT